MKRWPKRQANFWETAPFFRLLLPLIAGIVVYEHKWLSLSLNGILGLTAALFGFTLLLLFVSKNRISNVFQVLTFHGVVLLCGWLLSYYHDITNSEQWFGKQVGKADAYIARITETPEEKASTYKLETKLLYALNDSAATQADGKALVYVYQSKWGLPYGKGDTIILPDKWERITNSGNPFEFDYSTFIRREGIHYRQFLASAQIRPLGKGSPQDLTWVERSHDKCMELLATHIKDTAALGLMQAMLVGDRINLDSEIRDAYADTGIVHIIAISGSHVSIFFFVVALLFWWIRNKKYHWLKYLLALPLVWFYVLMAGAPPSAIRAATMFSLLAAGLAFNKDSNGMNTLFATAFILLCAEPSWLFAVGFQLSFVAVPSLILFFQPIYRLLPARNIVVKVLWGALAASIAAEILIAPMVIFYFHMFPLWFFVSNVLAYLFMGIVLVLGMLVIALSFIPPVADAVGWAISKLVNGFNEVVFALQKLNPEPLQYLVLSLIELVILYIFIAGLATYIRKQKKAGLFIGLSAACVLMIFLNIDEWQALKQDRLVVYNISGVVHAEHINGKGHDILATDTSKLNVSDEIFIFKPAHTGWRVWQEKTYSPTEVAVVNGKKVLFLNKPPEKDAKVFPVDYLVINYRKRKFDAVHLYKTYRFDKMIIAGTYGNTLQQRWKQQCDSLKIPLHATQFDGAFIAE